MHYALMAYYCILTAWMYVVGGERGYGCDDYLGWHAHPRMPLPCAPSSRPCNTRPNRYDTLLKVRAFETPRAN